MSKQRKIQKIIFCILAMILVIVFYEAIGIYTAYKKQPKVSSETKTAVQEEIKNWNQISENPERATIIEENNEALLQRIRLIQNAREEIILSTFAFHSDESGKLIMGALLEALSSHENIEVKIYNRANPLTPWKMMGRMHDKYLIADGSIYILGGRNTYNYFLGDFEKYKNYDRDVLVICENPQKENSVSQLLDYFENIWKQDDCAYFHEDKKLADKASVKKAALRMEEEYKEYAAEYKERIFDSDYTDETFETERITLVSNPIHTGAKEPVVWYTLGELMKNAKERVKIHTPYIICNEMMYNTWADVAKNVSEFSVMTNSAANNGNPFGSADYAVNRDKIVDTGIDIWEYEGGFSYHGKSILIDDNLSVIGSFNMDMRSAYLDTELMLVIRSSEINKQLEEGMMTYEKMSRQVLEDGTYNNPYHVEPIALTKKKQIKIFLVQHLLGWVRFLF